MEMKKMEAETGGHATAGLDARWRELDQSGGERCEESCGLEEGTLLSGVGNAGQDPIGYYLPI